MKRLCAITGLLVTGAWAQRYPFEARGQSELRSAVRSLLQDRSGALWVASEKQLFRFDGYRLERYPAQGAFTELAEDGDGVVWGAGAGGVERLSPPAARITAQPFTRLRSVGPGVMAAVDAKGVWLGRGTGGFTWAPALGAGLLLAVADGQLWTQCGDGVCATPVAALASGREVPVRSDLPVKDVWIDAQQARDGTLWLLGRRTLLHRAVGAERFEVEPFPAIDAAEDARLAINSASEPVLAAGLRVWWKRQQRWIALGAREGLGGRTQALFFDSEDSLWVGSTRGLARLIGEGRWQSWDETSGLQAFHLRGLARDARGTLWMGSRESVTTLQENNAVTPAIAAQLGAVTDVKQASDGSVWLAKESGGIARWSGGALQVFPSSPVGSLRVSANGTVWAASAAGLLRGGAAGFVPVPCPLVSDQAMREVREDPQDNIWVSNANGLLRWDGQTWQRYGKAEGLLHDSVGPFTIDDRGWIWLGYPDEKVMTWAEWSSARRQTVHYDKAPLPDAPSFIRHDREGRIWVGTPQGLLVTDGTRWERFRRGDGLVDDDVAPNGFHEDPDGTIWIATARGLSRYQPPENLFQPLVRAPTILWSVEGAPVPPAEIGPANRSITMQFGTSAFANPFAVRYRYRLQGFDDDWQMEERNFVRYANLPPGSYTFEAQAQSAAGVLSAAPARYAFRVLPPWYLTWWFRGFMLAAAAGVARLLWNWRLKLVERTNQRRVEAMVDEYPGPVCLLDREGRFRTVNREFERMAGVGRAALVGKEPKDVSSPMVSRRLAELLEEGRQRDGVTAGEESLETARGSVHLDARMFALRDAKGAVDSVCWIATDISERKRAERERDRAVASLRASEQRYRVFLENSQEGMLRIEFTPPVPTDLPEEEMIRLYYERGQMAECNDAHARLHGYQTARELIGHRGTALRDPELHRKQDVAFIRNGYRLMGLPGILKSVTGELRQIVYNVTGIIEDGKLARIWGTTQDVTEAKRLEEALRALSARQASAVEDERSRISREIHDELGQQLTALKMDLTLLQRSPSPQRLGELIQHIDDAVQTVRRIATELRPAILDHFGLAAAVEWQTAEFTKRSGLAHTVDVPEQLDVPRDLAITVFRILQEALTNVARHAQAEHVEVILREQGNELVLRVVDDGRGLPEKKSERPSLGILGMGERAAAFGGRVEIKPARPQGTEVLARFPLERGA